MFKRNWHYLLLLFLFVDVGISFFQHYHTALDGDLPNIVLPAERYEPLMNDPFALGVLLENKNYASPNRFFAHWFTAEYFKTVPLFLQNFVPPIDSVYLACAIIKILIQAFLLFLLAQYISGKRKFTDPDFIIAAALITPLFHTSGYYHYIGVIDHATTYTLFYAFPLSLFLLFFSPFYHKLFFKKTVQWNRIQLGCYFLLAIYLSLNGSIIPPLVLLIAALLVVSIFLKNRKNTQGTSIPQFLFRIKNELGKRESFLILAFCLFSLYSFGIGRRSIEGEGLVIALTDRYLRLPEGVFNMLTQKVGFPILIAVIFFNISLIKKQISTTESERILQFLKWIGIFALLYILLLPLGGYREYRPNIIRRDTFLPITICIFYAYGITSFYLLKSNLKKFRKWYVGLLVLVGVNFMVVDLPDFQNNKCERDALEKISKTKKDVIQLNNDCRIMTWIKVENPEFTKTNSQVLQLWNITEEPVLYFQK